MFDKIKPKEHLAPRCMAQNQPLSYLLLFPANQRQESRKMEGNRYKVLHERYIHPDPLEWPKVTHSCTLPTSPASSPSPCAVIWNCSSVTCVSLGVLQSPSFIGWRYPFHFHFPWGVLCTVFMGQAPTHPSKARSQTISSRNGIK